MNAGLTYCGRRLLAWARGAIGLSWRARLLLAACLVAFVNGPGNARLGAPVRLRLEDLPALAVAGAQRVLVIAPHPDDETLGAGGALQAALTAGAEVAVVVVTNGDGQMLAPAALRGRVVAGAADYVVSGEMRQGETLAALSVLGLPARSVVFLGYPDGALQQLWLDDWSTRCPLRARYTRSTHSPYPVTFNPQATYCGHDLLADLREIIAGFQPDLLLVPHPNDDHPDHRAVSQFARLALALERAANPTLPTGAWAYLIHYGPYPQPRGLRPGAVLEPPQALAGPENQWAMLELTPEQVQVKAQALRAHASQQRLLGNFLPSFARRNELFSRIEELRMPVTGLAQFPVNEAGLAELPPIAEPDPTGRRRVLVAGADLVRLRVGRLGDQLWLTAETRGPRLSGLRYSFLIKTPDGRTWRYTLPVSARVRDSASFTAHVDLAALGYPPAVVFAAEVRQGPTLDRTAWHVLAFTDALAWGETVLQ